LRASLRTDCEPGSHGTTQLRGSANWPITRIFCERGQARLAVAWALTNRIVPHEKSVVRSVEIGPLPPAAIVPRIVRCSFSLPAVVWSRGPPRFRSAPRPQACSTTAVHGVHLFFILSGVRRPGTTLDKMGESVVDGRATLAHPMAFDWHRVWPGLIWSRWHLAALVDHLLTLYKKYGPRARQAVDQLGLPSSTRCANSYCALWFHRSSPCRVGRRVVDHRNGSRIFCSVVLVLGWLFPHCPCCVPTRTEAVWWLAFGGLTAAQLLLLGAVHLSLHAGELSCRLSSAFITRGRAGVRRRRKLTTGLPGHVAVPSTSVLSARHCRLLLPRPRSCMLIPAQDIARRPGRLLCRVVALRRDLAPPRQPPIPSIPLLVMVYPRPFSFTCTWFHGSGAHVNGTLP